MLMNWAFSTNISFLYISYEILLNDYLSIVVIR